MPEVQICAQRLSDGGCGVEWWWLWCCGVGGGIDLHEISKTYYKVDLLDSRQRPEMHYAMAWLEKLQQGVQLYYLGRCKTGACPLQQHADSDIVALCWP